MNDPMSLASSHQTVASGERLMSLDALRGFDMMWIVGADALGHALAHVDAGPVVKTIATQLDHVPWAGFRFYDLIFPLFVFMIGVAVTFSLGRLVERQGRSAAVVRILRRTCLLYLLGLLYYGGICQGLRSDPLAGSPAASRPVLRLRRDLLRLSESPRARDHHGGVAGRILGDVDVHPGSGFWSGRLRRGTQSHQLDRPALPLRIQMGRRSRPGGDSIDAARVRVVPARRLRRTASAEPKMERRPPSGAPRRRRHRIAGRRLPLGPAVSHREEALDVVFRAGRGRLECVVAGLVLLRHRRARDSRLGGALLPGSGQTPSSST